MGQQQHRTTRRRRSLRQDLHPATADGTAQAWGRGAEGELGTGSTSAATTPQTVRSLDAVQPNVISLDTTYTYDAAGLRATATTAGQSTRYTWDPTNPLPALLSDGVHDYSYDPTGSPLDTVGPDGTQYFHADPLGSIRLTTSATGTVTGTSSYDAFGGLTSHSGSASTFGYAGQQTDPTGLQYLRARYYDPSAGRFLSTDPVAPQIDDPYVSTYVYANNTPTTLTDPSGQCLVICTAIIGAVVGAVVGGVGYAISNHDDFSWTGFGAAVGTGAVAGAVIGATAGIGVAAGSAYAGAAGLVGAGEVLAPAIGGAIGTTVGHYAVNAALSEPYTGRDAILDLATGGLAGALNGGFASLSRANQLFAASEECAGARAAARLPQDVNVNPAPPRQLPLNRPIGASATQNAALQAHIDELRAQGAVDIRVNQQQINVAGQRVGTNRPDLQYTLNGKRYYEEYDTPQSGRGPAHQSRLEANDPNGQVLLHEVP